MQSFIAAIREFEFVPKIYRSAAATLNCDPTAITGNGQSRLGTVN